MFLFLRYSGDFDSAHSQLPGALAQTPQGKQQQFSSVTCFSALSKGVRTFVQLHLINTHRDTGNPLHKLMCSAA